MVINSQTIKCGDLSVFCVIRDVTGSKALEHDKGSLANYKSIFRRTVILNESYKMLLI